MTVFNRKEQTLKCLDLIQSQDLPRNCQLTIYLTNDGCTDGTPAAVRERFPSIKIIDGDGTLFWNRGMYTAWAAAAKDRDYDFYLWLNDDTYLFEGAINELLHESSECKNNAIIVASIRSERKEEATYGGHSFKHQGLIVPNGKLQECATMNGNCVLVPRIIYQSCGNLDWIYRHAIGDLDYGYRVRKAGFKIYASREYLGSCEKKAHLPNWTRSEIPLQKRIENLYSPLGYAEPIPFFRFERRNFGLYTAIKHFITIHIRVLCPWLWKQH